MHVQSFMLPHSCEVLCDTSGLGSWVSWWGGQLEEREELFLGAACVLCSLFCSVALVLLALLVL